MVDRSKILEEINKEREYQIKRWGNGTDDTANMPNDFASYIARYATKWHAGEFAPYTAATVDAYRESMIKVAAIAVAAVESLDRQRNADTHAFYEKPSGP